MAEDRRFAKAVGRRIRALRNARGWTQKQLGEKAGLGHWGVCHYENGNYQPNCQNLRQLAEALEVTTDELLGLTPERPPRVGDDLSARIDVLELVPLEYRAGLVRLIDSYLETHRLDLTLLPHGRAGPATETDRSLRGIPPRRLPKKEDAE